MNLEQELINTAKKDLSASQSLYETEHFSTAIFMLQQCIEKCIKSYGITIGIIEEKDLAKKISHNAHKIFAREVKAKIDKLKLYKNTPLLIPEMIPPHQRGESKIESDLEFLERLYEKINFIKINELGELEENELRGFIVNARTYKIQEIENEQEYFNYFKEDWIKSNKHFQNYFKEVFTGNELDEMLDHVKYCLENADYFATNRLTKFKYDIEKEQITNNLIFIWFNLSIILTPHEQKSRYPTTASKSLDEIYNKNHILVKWFDDLVYVIDKSIAEYCRMYLNN